MEVLLFGSTGWIGTQLWNYLLSFGKVKKITKSQCRLEDYGRVGLELDLIKPTHVLVAAGLVGNPNIDSLEDDRIRATQINTIGPSVLADECYRRNIHYTLIGTGCIFEYDNKHPIGGPGFTEEETPNFAGSFYSYSKIMTEGMVKQFPTSLILRIRMPIASDLNPKCFISKITKYKKVINTKNSMSVLEDLLPLVPELMDRKTTGILNFVNPGTISHNEILDLYQKYIDINFKYNNFTVEEQDKILKARLSNNQLDTSRLESLFPDRKIPPINESIHRILSQLKN